MLAHRGPTGEALNPYLATDDLKTSERIEEFVVFEVEVPRARPLPSRPEVIVDALLEEAPCVLEFLNGSMRERSRGRSGRVNGGAGARAARKLPLRVPDVRSEERRVGEG